MAIKDLSFPMTIGTWTVHVYVSGLLWNAAIFVTWNVPSRRFNNVNTITWNLNKTAQGLYIDGYSQTAQGLDIDWYPQTTQELYIDWYTQTAQGLYMDWYPQTAQGLDIGRNPQTAQGLDIGRNPQTAQGLYIDWYAKVVHFYKCNTLLKFSK